MDCSPPGSSVYGIFQARILEQVASSSSRVSSWPRDQTHVSYISCIGRQILFPLYHLSKPCSTQSSVVLLLIGSHWLFIDRRNSCCILAFLFLFGRKWTLFINTKAQIFMVSVFIFCWSYQLSVCFLWQICLVN